VTFAAGMAWRSDRLVIAVKRMAAALDTHFVFGAAFNCDRRLRTGLPVDQVKHPNFGGFSQGIQIGLASFFAALFAAFFSALLHAC
jgi:hypothetical protein